LTADGVVGSNTWGSLVTELYFVTDDGTYKYYKIGASGPSSIFRMGDFTTDWYMRKLNGTWATNFDTNGPS
jgi:ribosomal protein L15E